MHLTRLSTLTDTLRLLLCVLILRITAGVIWNYREYMPPDFESEFLFGRQDYFFGGYQWAFYAHITSGPCSLVLGMILLSERFRRRFTQWHRRLGRIQTANVLLLLTPSGLWMAFYAATGAIAGAGFAMLAVATGVSVLIGWRSAVARRIAEHRRWMWRCYLLPLAAFEIIRLGQRKSQTPAQSAQSTS